jgi:threonine/homoserine/homoserine lactone efflux protein
LLKVAGGLYLTYLGVRIWLGAKQPLTDSSSSTVSGARPTRSFAMALVTQLSNPKAAIIYASVFAAFLPERSSTTFQFAVIAMVFAIETGWYALVASVLSSQRPRLAYLRFKKWIDRAAGGIMLGLGVKLITSAGR